MKGNRVKSRRDIDKINGIQVRWHRSAVKDARLAEPTIRSKIHLLLELPYIRSANTTNKILISILVSIEAEQGREKAEVVKSELYVELQRALNIFLLLVNFLSQSSTSYVTHGLRDQPNCTFLAGAT